MEDGKKEGKPYERKRNKSCPKNIMSLNLDHNQSMVETSCKKAGFPEKAVKFWVGCKI